MGLLWHMWQERRNDADAQKFCCGGLDAKVLGNSGGGEMFMLVGKHTG